MGASMYLQTGGDQEGRDLHLGGGTHTRGMSFPEEIFTDQFPDWKS